NRIPAHVHAIHESATLRQLALVRAYRLTLSQDFSRDALANLALRATVFQQEIIGMRVDVDKPGRDNETFGVYLALSLARRNASNRDDAITVNGQVALEPRIAAAVDDSPIAYEQIVCWLGGRQYGGPVDHN